MRVQFLGQEDPLGKGNGKPQYPCLESPLGQRRLVGYSHGTEPGEQPLGGGPGPLEPVHPGSYSTPFLNCAPGQVTEFL